MGMVVGLCEVCVRIRAARSLKEKRGSMKKIIERTRARFGVSISETGEQDLLQQGRIGFSFVSHDRRKVQSTLDTVVRFMRELYVAEICDVDQEIISWSESWSTEEPLTLADFEASKKDFS